MTYRQKRSSIRIESDLPVAVVAETDKKSPLIVGAAHNISLGGIHFDSDLPLNVGQKVTLQLSTAKGVVEFSAIVLRKDEDGYACEFADADLTHAKVLAETFFPAFEP